jgi:hypothetical protein
MSSKSSSVVATMGIDIGKNTFHLDGVSRSRRLMTIPSAS